MSTRSGFALLLSLLLTLALSMLAMGAMAAAIRETALARTLERREEARVHAEAAVLGALDRWSTRAFSHLPIGGDTVLAAAPAETEVLRIGPALYVVRASSSSGPNGEAIGRAGLLVRTFDLDDALARLPAAVTLDVDGRLEHGLVSGEDGCGPDVPAVFGPSLEVETGVQLLGTVPFRFGRPAASPMTPELSVAVDPVEVEAGAVLPRPHAVGGVCIPAPDNWGALAPEHPCYELLPIVLGRGSVTVSGGVGRGVLIVDGDLVLDGASRFEGLIVSSGRTTVDGGSQVRGAVWATRFELRDGMVQRSECALRVALASPAMDRAFRPSGRWWIPIF